MNFEGRRRSSLALQHRLLRLVRQRSKAWPCTRVHPVYRTDEIQRGSSINDPKFTRNRILRDSARLSLCQYVAEERRSFFELPRFPSFRQCGIVDHWTSCDHFVSLLIGNASSNNQPVPFTIDRSADRDYPCVPLG